MVDFREVCAGAVAAKGGFRVPWVRDAFAAVDRAHFVPAKVWDQTVDADGRYPLIDREADAEGWYRAAWDPHHSVITQLDDHRLPDTPARGGTFTSSISAPDIVAEKLCLLDLEPGQRVLELGTGSGYVTALLCERVGDANVTTVEIDPHLSAWGAANLAAAGYRPETVCGDGMNGRPEGGPSSPYGPYDRIIATAAVRRIPRAWIAQCTPGAVILTPFGTAYANGGLLKLTVRPDGSAHGPFVGTALYM
ncbi:protein-L-isoaspartate O-methyltransferase family protein [Streptomyces daliensis]|uniref:Protein-L-isoaspartate O-methyltransferase n=1 Tax=Streptomyces daliensis TaxID=299421 RepID=A0A8T4IMI5_9ACTN|nr:methyltransferase domain-containing protein [Streptomyces daliensis]